jgi:acetyl-CoA acetyltransferase
LGHSAPGGDLPVNTNGGGLSYTHTGRLGMFALQESVRQLRGEAEAQVPGVETSLALGVAHFFSGAGVVIMSSRP